MTYFRTVERPAAWRTCGFAGRDGVADGSYRLAGRLVDGRQKIDVAAFGRKFDDHATTHTTHPVEFMSLDNNGC